MLGTRFNQAKCETTSRLCIGRIKLLRNKKTVQLKQSQKDIAELLRTGKQEYARIRVEGVIREKYLMQAYEILELYLELLTVRVQLVAKTKELPRDMMEAVSSIIYAAQRISDLPELATLRALFASKYGKEYAAEAAADATASRWQVNANMIRCLVVEAPQPEEKLEMLSEIAQEHGVEWDLSAAARDMGVGAAGPSGQLPHGLNNDPGAAATAAATAAAAAAAAAMAAADGRPAARYPAMGAAPASTAPAPAPVLGFNHVQYANAQQAAVAAAQAAAQANAAAQYAAQVAALTQQGAAAVIHGTAIPQLPFQVVPAAAPFPTAAMVAARSSPSPPPAQFPQVPNDGEALESAPSPSPGLGPAASSGGGGGSGASAISSVGGYVVRSDSDIQRAYDAAQGPPTKGAFVTAPPPLPPLPPPPPPVPGLAAAPPSPPSEKGQPSAPSVDQTAEDEYEELTRRLEALKRS